MSFFREPFSPDNQSALLVPLPSLLALGDIGITLSVQSPNYWKGSYECAYDFNPLVQFSLQVHPLLSLIAAFTWIPGICFAMLFLRESLRNLLYLTLVAGHFICIAGWIIRTEPLSIPLVVGIGIPVLLIALRQISPGADEQTTFAR